MHHEFVRVFGMNKCNWQRAVQCAFNSGLSIMCGLEFSPYICLTLIDINGNYACIGREQNHRLKQQNSALKSSCNKSDQLVGFFCSSISNIGLGYSCVG